jgi:hypothetical protein
MRRYSPGSKDRKARGLDKGLAASFPTHRLRGFAFYTRYGKRVVYSSFPRGSKCKRLCNRTLSASQPGLRDFTNP